FKVFQNFTTPISYVKYNYDGFICNRKIYQAESAGVERLFISNNVTASNAWRNAQYDMGNVRRMSQKMQDTLLNVTGIKSIETIANLQYTQAYINAENGCHVPGASGRGFVDWLARFLPFLRKPEPPYHHVINDDALQMEELQASDAASVSDSLAPIL